MTHHETSAGEMLLQGTPLRWPPRLGWRERRIWWICVLVALGTVSTVVGIILSRSSAPLLVASFPRAEKLITNERAYFDPHHLGIHTSPEWIVTSGSLFSYDGAGWTGVPDGVAPDITSSNGTDSAVFRAVTRRADFTNVAVSFSLKISSLVTTQRTPADAFDGVHVFVRYKNPRYLYVVSVYRRDGIVAVKEKIPGGPANGGTYFTLAQARYKIPLHNWVPVRVTIVTLADRAVRIQLILNGRQVLTMTDTGNRVSPIMAGRVGLRGDNCEFFFRNFTVTPIAS
jgi:hypothetical protein